MDTKLQKLKKQREVIQARIRKIEALGATKKRKQEKHLKFLIGEYCLNEAIQAGTLNELKQKLLNSLKREIDKVLVNEW